MKIWRDVAGAPAQPIHEPSVVTIGVFDGVHRGHQALLSAVRATADKYGLVSTAITFDPHPITIFAPSRAPSMLTSVERRVELLHECGMDHVRVLAFDREMSEWSPAAFLDRVIVEQCGARHVIVGENFRFGSGAKGDFGFLRSYGQDHGFTSDLQTLAGDTEVFSSTRVREALSLGNVELAASILGRFHEVSGTVVKGQQRGRDLGFPTANIEVDESMTAPSDGVYAGWLSLGSGEAMAAAISVGSNPTFEGDISRRVESYVLDRNDLNLYGKVVQVQFVAKVRDMLAFASIEELLAAMETDVTKTRDLLRC